MARLHVDLKEYDIAVEYLNKAKKFKHYLTESMVSFRVKLSFDRIKKLQEVSITVL